MNKKGISEPRKTLVRNTSRSVPSTTVIKATTRESVKLPSTSSSRRVPSSKSQLESARIYFDEPQFNSVLKVTKKLDLVEKTKSLPVLLTFDEKVTRQVNFPYDKAIYKDLIPLEGLARTSSMTTTSREPLPMKDKEPNLNEFIDERQVKDFLYQSKLKIDEKTFTFDDSHANLRIYRLLQNYEI